MANAAPLFDMKVAISIGVAYVWVYYGIAGAVLARIHRQAPDYFDLDSKDGGLPFGPATSMAIMDMLLDTDLPGSAFDRPVKYGLYAARTMLALGIPIIGFVLWLAV